MIYLISIECNCKYRLITKKKKKKDNFLFPSELILSSNQWEIMITWLFIIFISEKKIRLECRKLKAIWVVESCVTAVFSTPCGTSLRNRRKRANEREKEKEKEKKRGKSSREKFLSDKSGKFLWN